MTPVQFLKYYYTVSNTIMVASGNVFSVIMQLKRSNMVNLTIFYRQPNTTWSTFTLRSAMDSPSFWQLSKTRILESFEARNRQSGNTAIKLDR